MKPTTTDHVPKAHIKQVRIISARLKYGIVLSHAARYHTTIEPDEAPFGLKIVFILELSKF
jgi:hypothetical protein